MLQKDFVIGQSNYLEGVVEEDPIKNYCIFNLLNIQIFLILSVTRGEPFRIHP